MTAVLLVPLGMGLTPAVSGGTAGTDGAHVPRDGFEDDRITDTWTVARNDAGGSVRIDQETVRFGDRALNVTVDYNPGHFKLVHDFAARIDRVTVFSFWVKASRRRTAIHYSVSDPNGPAKATVHFGPWGDVRFATDRYPSGGRDDNVLLSDFSARTWYKVEIVLRPASGTVDFSVRDRTGRGGGRTGVPGSVDVRRVSLSGTDYNTGYEFWVDEVSFRP